MIAALLQRTALRDWRAVTGLFFTSTLLESFAMGHLEAFTPLFLRDELGLASEQVAVWTGLLSAASFAIGFPLSPFWGSLAERYSRRLIIVRSQYIEALGYTLSGLAPDLTWFLLARLLLGLTFGNIAVVIATQSLLTPERRVASGISLVQAANPIALSLGPPVGALLVPYVGLRGLFIADGLLCLLAALLVTFLMPEPTRRGPARGVMASLRGAVGMVWRRAELRWNFAAWFLTRGAMSVAGSYLPVRIAELARGDPAQAIGFILGGFGLLTTLFTWAAGRLVDRVGAAVLFWPAMLLGAVCVAGTALAPWLWLVAAFAWLRSIPVALTGTVLYAHLAQALRREERGPVMSFTPVPRNVAAFVVPLLGAAAAALGSPAALMVAAAAYGAATWVGYQLLVEHRAAARARAQEEGAASLEEAAPGSTGG